MNSIEILFDFFEDHTRAADHVRHSQPVAFGMLCFAIAGASIFIGQAVGGRLAPFTFSLMSLGMMVVWEIVLGVMLTAVLHLVVEFEGVRGSAAALFVLLGLANLVWVLIVPIALILRWIAPSYPWLGSIAGLGVGLLVLGYKARSIQDNYQISAARAWVTLFVPYLALLFAVALGVTIAVVGLLGQFVRWMS